MQRKGVYFKKKEIICISRVVLYRKNDTPSRAAPPSLPLFTCRTTASTALPPPTPTPTYSIPQSPPLTCALHSPHFLSCRAKLAVRGSSTEPLIGLYEEGTHNVVDIPQCQADHPNIKAAVELLRRGITELGVEPFIEDEGAGDLHVQMAVTTYNTSLPTAQICKNGYFIVQVTLVWNSRNENSPGSDKLNALVNFLWKNGGPHSRLHLIHSVWANFQTSTNNIIFGDKWKHLLGERDFWEHVGGIDVSLAPSSFGQANTLRLMPCFVILQAFDALLRKLQKYVPYESAVADLYAGAGVIGLSLATTRKCRSIKCIEINKESNASFEKTIERLPATVDSSITWHHAYASKEPFLWLLGSDLVVIDPPRKGLDASLIDALKNISSVERKAFSNSSQEEKRPWVIRAKEDSVQIGSKPPANIAQSDCKSLLSSKAWYLEKAHGFNFFPGTQSIEVLAVFKRGPQKKKQGKKKKKHL
ncbi:hypothetical protein AAZX31_19G080200 [Glycine max]